MVTICDESGEPCFTIAEQQELRGRHFTKVLSVRNQFVAAGLLGELRQRETDVDLGTEPSLGEVG